MGITLAADAPEPELEILASNAEAVAVYRHCRADYLMGFSALVYHGVAAPEIIAVASILKVDCDEELLWRIKVLDAAYGKETNRKNSPRRAGKK